MALAEIELARVHRAMDSFMQRRRPPAHIRSSVDLAFRITGQSVEILEIRPAWRGPANEEAGIADSEGDLRQISWCVARVLAASQFEMAQLRPDAGGQIRRGICITGRRGCACLLPRLSMDSLPARAKPFELFAIYRRLSPPSGIFWR